MERRSQAGITTLEATISLTIFAVALLTLWGTLVYCSRSNIAMEQKKRALNAALAKIEDLRSIPFDELIAEYGPGGATGDTFRVPLLSDDDSTGRIVFYVDETASSGGTDVGLPRDLNGDGDQVDTDVSGDYTLLPVRVTVVWNSALGPQSVMVGSVLGGDQ